MNCDHVDDVLAELAAGTLSGAERAYALAHISECHTCARRLAELTEAADAVLLTAPPAAPPTGFEVRVVDAIAPPRRAPRRRYALLAAAAIVLVAGVAAAAIRPTHHRAPAVRTATMRTEGRATVGYAYATLGAPDRVLVQIHGLHESDATYRVVLTLRSGQQTTAGTLALRGGAGVADLVSPEPTRDVASVKVVGATGEYKCEGDFSGA